MLPAMLVFFASPVLVWTQTPTAAGQQTAQPPEAKRLFGFLPNYSTAEASQPFHRLTPGQKMKIAAKDAFDWPVYPTAAGFAALYQLENQNPSFGQGMKGYAKRFGTAYGDQLIGDMLGEGVIPILFREDPRYFRLGQGSTAARTGHALIHLFVARTDSGSKSLNVCEWGGDILSTAIANLSFAVGGVGGR
jgi:hypothetical protein